MEVKIEHLGGVQFEIKARQHTIVSDQPLENGGFDEGMTPPELLLASLGSCAGFYAAQYLRKHRLASEGTLVRVFAEKTKDPARIDNFRIELQIPVELTEEHRKRRGRKCAPLPDSQYFVACSEDYVGSALPGTREQIVRLTLIAISAACFCTISPAAQDGSLRRR